MTTPAGGDRDPGADRTARTGPSADDGADADAQTGADAGAHTGVKPGADTGVKPGADTGVDSRTRPNPDRSTDMTSPGPTSDAGFRPDQPLNDPLPYGAGFSAPEPLGFGVAPESVPSPTRAVDVTERRRGGSPVLAVAGLASLGVAVWAILGAPVITPTLLLAAGLVLAVLVGLMMVLRR